MTTTSSTSSTTGQVNTTSSGQTYITGTVSGLDTNTLINNAVSTYETNQGYTRDSDQVSTNTSKISAYQTLQTDIANVQSALTALKSAANTTGNTTNSSSTGSAFDTKGVSYSTSDGSTASNVLTATADGTATTGNHTVIVTQMAQTMQVTGTSVSSETSALGYSGSFDIATAGNTASTISITSSMSLEDIKNAINAHSSTTGVSADILQVSSGSYELVLNGSDTNKQIDVTNVSGNDVLTSLGVTTGTTDGNGNANFTTVSQKAQPAKITFDGTSVTSDTNTFNNILTGVDLDVSSAAPDTTVTVDITNNTSGVSTAINNLITAYNSLSDYVVSNQQVNSDGSVSSSESLFGDSILNTLGQEMNKLITGNGHNSGSVNSLGALGITLDSSNHLTISNQTTLTNALDNNFSSVQSLFATQFTSNNANLTVAQNTSSLSASFTLQVTTDGSGNITSVTAGSDAANADFTINGTELVGKAGTAYAGLTLNYAGASGARTTSINVSVQQGIADQLMNTLDNYGNSNTGLIAQQISQLQTTDTTLNTQISNIQTQANAYQQTLINKYAAMETSISNADILEQTISALLNNSSSSSSSSG